MKPDREIPFDVNGVEIPQGKNRGVLTLMYVTEDEARELISRMWGECVWGPEGTSKTAYPTGSVRAAFSRISRD